MAVLKIKDCPFCGGVDCFSFVDPNIKMWSVACSDCGSSCGKYENNEAAILKWNERSDIKKSNFTSTNNGITAKAQICPECAGAKLVYALGVSSVCQGCNGTGKLRNA